MAAEISVRALSGATAAAATATPPSATPPGAAEVVSDATLAADTASMNQTSTPLWKDYLVLTKPRVISLLLFTTLCGMVIAQRGWPGWGLFVATAIGFYMAAGAAHTINMILDRDLDARMPRTANRPLVAGRISVRSAAIFAAILGAGSMLLLCLMATPLSALMALSGLAFYVVVYTMLLKRRTWHNIVIGGAAGAFPPLVGWAAVKGDISDLGLLAWLLFAIIFVWTPVHFWALAILIKDDYAEAGVPMLPVVRGERATSVQIGLYALATVGVTFAPLLIEGAVGWLYVGAATLLNGVLLLKSFHLWRLPERKPASSLFHYSMLYLALLFLAMALDRVRWT